MAGKRFRASRVGHSAWEMPGRLYEIRYPDNYFEIDASGQNAPPNIGETIRRRGRLWKVTARTEGPPVIVQVVASRQARLGITAEDFR